MAINYQLSENNEYKLKEKLSDSINYFDLCPKCSIYQNTIKDWMKHLVDRHPLPIEWMSDSANYLTDDKLKKPYTTVTESRKKRKKNITPRPLNSFMIFSRHLRRNVLLFFNDASNSEISKLLGKLWNNISSPIKSMYDSEAKKLAILHSKEFPEYKYQPKKKKKLYLTKRNIDSCTPLSNNSYESVSDNIQFSVSNGARKCSNFQTDTNPASVSSYRNLHEAKSNSLMIHNSKSNNFPKHDLNKDIKKASRHPHKIVISNQILDDSEGAESSPSSFKNTLKNEIMSTYSPFNNELNSDISDLHFTSSIKHETDLASKYSPRPDDNFTKDSDDSHRFNVNKYQHILHKNICPPINLTTPLTIVTDKVDDFNRFQTARTNFHFVKIIDKAQFEKCHEVTMKESVKVTNLQSNLNVNQINYLKDEDKTTLDRNQNSHLVETHLSEFINSHQPSYVEPPHQDINRKCNNLDPLIFEDMFDNDNYDDDSLNFNNLINNNNSPWQFKSPNFKPSTGSSNASDKETYEASSPFHLSENENHATPIQRLPAIGSWLRTNYSEFMI